MITIPTLDQAQKFVMDRLKNIDFFDESFVDKQQVSPDASRYQHLLSSSNIMLSLLPPSSLFFSSS